MGSISKSLGRIGKQFTRQAERSVRDVGNLPGNIYREGERTASNVDQGLESLSATAMDPNEWAKGFSTFGASFMDGVRDNYEAMDTAEKELYKAEYEEAQALAEEQKLIEEQEADIKKQEGLAAEREAKSDAEQADRAQRLASGRKGLLYGRETGLNSSKQTIG